jgi:hypothetical protein
MANALSNMKGERTWLNIERSSPAVKIITVIATLNQVPQMTREIQHTRRKKDENQTKRKKTKQSKTRQE